MSSSWSGKKQASNADYILSHCSHHKSVNESKCRDLEQAGISYCTDVSLGYKTSDDWLEKYLNASKAVSKGVLILDATDNAGNISINCRKELRACQKNGCGGFYYWKGGKVHKYQAATVEKLLSPADLDGLMVDLFGVSGRDVYQRLFG